MEPAETANVGKSRVRSLVVAVVVAALVAFGLYAAVNGKAGASSSDDGYSPAEVGAPSPAGVSRLTLEQPAVDRLGLVTAPVRAGDKGRRVIPYSAVVYDPEGVAWTYVNTAPLTYVRREVGVTTVDGVAAVLTSGPPIGTKVVSVGGAELFGAEIDFGKG